MTISTFDLHEIKDVCVEMPPEVFNKIMAYVDLCQMEVGGLGRVVWEKRSDLLVAKIQDVYLVDQEVSASTTDLDAAAVGKLVYETRNLEGSIGYWWHSHVSMSTFWSGQDHQCMYDFIDQGGMAVFGVFNKRKENRHAYLQMPEKANGGLSLFRDDINMNVNYPEPPAAYKQIFEKEIKDKVKEKVFKQTYVPVWQKNKYGYGYKYNKATFDEHEDEIDDAPKNEWWNRPEYNNGHKVKKTKNKDRLL